MAGAAQWDDIPVEMFEAVRSLFIDSVTATVATAFDEAGIRSLLIKGPTISGWIYPDGGREYGDTDLMISPADFPAAERILEGLGFEYQLYLDSPGAPPWHAHTWVRPTDGANVDLHRTLIGATAAPEDVWAVLTRETESMTVAGKTMETMDAPAKAMLIAMHCSQHGLMTGKPAVDLALALEHLPEETWIEAQQRASSIGAIESFGAGLRMNAAGAALAERLEVAQASSVEVLIRASGSTDLALGFEWLATRPGPKEKLTYALHELFPPPDFMRTWWKVATHGWMGLVLAYVFRPFWLLARAPKGYRAWRRARIASRAAQSAHISGN